jgi:hypothetical protein
MRLAGAGLVVLLAVCLAALVGGRPGAGRALAPHVYGVDDARMQAAVNAAQWPQQVFNWCGVATLAAIADFNGAGVSQAGAAGYLNSGAATSIWGTPSFIYPGPAFRADIARDSGTDPRSLAAGLAGLSGGRYHALVDHWGPWDATARLAADIEYSGQPITVFVDHGLHSVVVSKVYANGDPATNPGSIYALEVWDPGFGSAFDAQIQTAQHVEVSLGAWLSWGVYWGLPYESNGTWDPDPSVGSYTYNPGQGDYNHLWIGNWVYVQPWGPGGVSADWSVDQQDVVIPGQHGELPPGYVLPTPTPAPGERIARTAPTVRAARPTPVPHQAQFGTPNDTGQPTPAAPVLEAVPTGITICLGPYCLQAVNLWWLAVAGALLLLALALGIGAALAQWRANHRRRRRDARAAAAAGSVVVTEVAGAPPPLLLSDGEALAAPSSAAADAAAADAPEPALVAAVPAAEATRDTAAPPTDANGG